MQGEKRLRAERASRADAHFFKKESGMTGKSAVNGLSEKLRKHLQLLNFAIE